MNVSLLSLKSKVCAKMIKCKAMILSSKLVLVIVWLQWTTAEAANRRPKEMSSTQMRMKTEWENTDAHPPLNRTEAENDFFNRVLYKTADWSYYYYDYEGPQPRVEGPTCFRREYRTMSEASRRELHDALNTMKSTVVDNNTHDNRTEYDVFVGYHRFDVSGGSHYGPGFLPWHREYLLRFERALQRHSPGVCLPYVDWTLDQGIPAPGESALWTPNYLGNWNGSVSVGFAANWTAYPEDCARKWPLIYRKVIQSESAKNVMYNDTGINGTIQKTRYQDLCSPYTDQFEGNHGSVHGYIGGHMSLLACAPNDPVFFFHHCFIDYLFEVFRQRYQQSVVDKDYPRDSFVPHKHHAEDEMKPFDGMLNIDGLSTNYTERFYDYTSSPHECDEDEDCQSEVLWCNKALKRCLAKIREGGRCDKLPDEACYTRIRYRPCKNVNGLCSCTEDD